MPLSDTAIRNAKPDTRPLRLYDSGGLYLEIAPSGGKWWRFAYRFGGKRKLISLGVYPDVPLAGRKVKGKRIEGARDKRDDARKLLAAGVDPSAKRQADKRDAAGRAANSFEVVAREWYARQATAWKPKHAS